VGRMVKEPVIPLRLWMPAVLGVGLLVYLWRTSSPDSVAIRALEPGAVGWTLAESRSVGPPDPGAHDSTIEDPARHSVEQACPLLPRDPPVIRELPPARRSLWRYFGRPEAELVDLLESSPIHRACAGLLRSLEPQLPLTENPWYTSLEQFAPFVVVSATEELEREQQRFFEQLIKGRARLAAELFEPLRLSVDGAPWLGVVLRDAAMEGPVPDLFSTLANDLRRDCDPRLIEVTSLDRSALVRVAVVCLDQILRSKGWRRFPAWLMVGLSAGCVEDGTVQASAGARDLGSVFDGASLESWLAEHSFTLSIQESWVLDCSSFVRFCQTNQRGSRLSAAFLRVVDDWIEGRISSAAEVPAALLNESGSRSILELESSWREWMAGSDPGKR